MKKIDGLLVREVPNCPLCGERGHELYTDMRDRLFDAPGVWSLRQCLLCRHVWLSPFPASGEIWKLYTSYFTHKQTERIKNSPAANLRNVARRALLYAMGYRGVTKSVWEKYLGKLLYLIPLMHETVDAHVMFLKARHVGRLLDIGCGNGSFLHRMSSLGWEVSGVEVDTKAVRIARERYGFQIIEGALEKVELPSGAFDAVTLNHVIEHVYDPTLVLGICHRTLRLGGMIIIKTPNVDSWGHRVFGESWTLLDPPRHLHLFSMQNLRSCVERVGFSVSSLRTTALGASGVYHVSQAIRTTGGFDRSDTSTRPTLRGYAFRFLENLIQIFRKAAGEEIILLATKVRTRMPK